MRFPTLLLVVVVHLWSGVILAVVATVLTMTFLYTLTPLPMAGGLILLGFCFQFAQEDAGASLAKSRHLWANAVDISTLLMGGATILGIITIQANTYTNLHAYNTKEAEYHALGSIRNISLFKENFCSGSTKFSAFCEPLSLFSQQLSQDFDQRTNSNVREQLETLLNSQLCDSDDWMDLPYSVQTVCYHLREYLAFLSAFSRTEKLVRKKDNSTSMFSEWVDFEVVRLFLVYLGAVALGIKLATIIIKYKSECTSAD